MNYPDANERLTNSLQVSAGYRASQLAFSGVGCVPPPAPPELKRYALVAHAKDFWGRETEVRS
jgi:hypothetical protein